MLSSDITLPVKHLIEMTEEHKAALDEAAKRKVETAAVVAALRSEVRRARQLQDELENVRRQLREILDGLGEKKA